MNPHDVILSPVLSEKAIGTIEAGKYAFYVHPDANRSQVSGIGTFCVTPAGAHSTNAGGKGDARWVTGNAHDEKGMVLAYQVQKSLTEDLHCDDRGVRRARYQVLREARMPAILIEGGFLSNPAEGRKIAEASYRRRMARAIAQGILAYQRIVKK